MKKRNFSLLAAWIVLGSAHSASASSFDGSTFKSYHDDYRRTPKLEEFEAAPKNEASDAETVAWDFLKQHASDYEIDLSLNNLSAPRVQESLIGKHFHFNQSKEGIDVQGAEVVISVAKEGNYVYRAFNNYYPESEQFLGGAKKATLRAEQAYDIAWNDLKVHGKLQDTPKADVKYIVTGKGHFQLVYVTYLNTAAPFGAWEHVIDAHSGKIVSRQDTRLERKLSANKIDPMFYNGPIDNRADAFKQFFAAKMAKAKKAQSQPANGTGLVFDPDPRTTLQSETLQDEADAAVFEDAYFQKELLDLAFDGTTYKLEGPWVKIADFESPTTAPSTSTTGAWTAKRGSNAFNDVMTYYHVDKNQRYMQSLGFTGEKAIQGAPISVDADGVGGADNSHFIPNSNTMAFGHGCVDDNEDADVILHEYGHAINFSINNNWNGGDTGAMGEGFGDYWAGSYSYSTQNGNTYKPFEVFTWDGHGQGAPCWPGRALDAVEMRYNPTVQYGAHQPVGQRQSDELWSTPLFQALVELIAQGVAREEVDQIILEAQFGLGSGLKMRELAEATVATAHRLRPNGPHAKVLQNKFVAQQIIDVPHAILKIQSNLLEGMGDNNTADPGEHLNLTVALMNSGTLKAQGIQATLVSQTDGVTIVDSRSSFADLEIGASTSNALPLSLNIAENIACGTLVRVMLNISYEGGTSASASIPVEFRVGKAIGADSHVSLDLAIPENSQTGITNEIMVDVDGVVTANFAIDLNIEHTYIGDLTVALTSPAGTTVVLHAKTGGSTSNIVGRYPTTLTPSQPLSGLLGQPLRGAWKLMVKDTASGDNGQIKGWGINDITGFQCVQ